MDGSADATFLPGLVLGIEKTPEKGGSCDAHIHAHTHMRARANTQTHSQATPSSVIKRCVCVAPVNADVLSVACIHWSHTHTPLNF